METIDRSNFDDYGSDLSAYQIVGVFAVNAVAWIRDWLSSPVVVKNMLLVLIAFTVGQRHGVLSASKEPLAAAAPRLSIDEKEMMARFHENYLRLKANGTNRIANSSPR